MLNKNYALLQIVENNFRMLKKTYGIGSYLSLSLNNHMGYHPQFKYKNIPQSYLMDGLKNLLLSKTDLLGSNLKKQVENNIILEIKLNTYKGYFMRNHLPVRGQRRRTNGKTARKLAGRLSRFKFSNN